MSVNLPPPNPLEPKVPQTNLPLPGSTQKTSTQKSTTKSLDPSIKQNLPKAPEKPSPPLTDKSVSPPQSPPSPLQRRASKTFDAAIKPPPIIRGDGYQKALKEVEERAKKSSLGAGAAQRRPIPGPPTPPRPGTKTAAEGAGAPKNAAPPIPARPPTPAAAANAAKLPEPLKKPPMKEQQPVAAAVPKQPVLRTMSVEEMKRVVYIIDRNQTTDNEFYKDMDPAIKEAFSIVQQNVNEFSKTTQNKETLIKITQDIDKIAKQYNNYEVQKKKMKDLKEVFAKSIEKDTRPELQILVCGSSMWPQDFQNGIEHTPQQTVAHALEILEEAITVIKPDSNLLKNAYSSMKKSKGFSEVFKSDGNLRARMEALGKKISVA